MTTMKAMKGNRKHLSIYVDPEVSDALKMLSAKTRIPQQSHLREAVDDLLAKYKQSVVKRARATSGAPRNVHVVRSPRRAK